MAGIPAETCWWEYCDKIHHKILEFIVLAIYTFWICLMHGRWNTLKDNMSSASQEIPRILWNPNARSRIHNSPPSVQSMSPHLTSCRSSLILSPFYAKIVQVVSFHQIFHQNPVRTSLHPIHATCPAYPIILDMITPIIPSDCKSLKGARSSAVGWDTALQAGRSRVRFPMESMEFFIDINLTAALRP